MTIVFLVRHAEHEAGTDRLLGRMAGVRLSAEGRRQALRLAERLRDEGVTAIHASPRERAVETAEAIAAQCDLPVRVEEALDEVDFGAWSGRSFRELDDVAEWKEWNASRAAAATPSGATMGELAARIAGHIARCCASEPDGRIVLVSHAEPIRAAVLHVLGLPLGAYDRIQIDMASVTTLAAGEWGARLCAMNERIR